ncbi:MAG: aspartate--tRNA ligase [Bacteroidia bacterium]
MQTFYRTHLCGTLNETYIGQKVKVTGWLRRLRDMGAILFIDLRDKTGWVQLFIPRESVLYPQAKNLQREYVLQIEGIVRKRESPNPHIPTGQIEIEVHQLNILNTSALPPFLIEEETDASEELRLRYRYLDLRRPPLQRNLSLRAQVVRAVRTYLDENGFTEIETPLLIRSTPEGARDFLVPARLQPGHFYALPQSPQLLKQLLIIAGFDRYYQIARCLRDEDYRGDRQAEFSQIDCEMAFVSQEDVLQTFEGMVRFVYEKVLGISLPPFPRLSHAEALKAYGTDKPDLRYSIKWIDITPWAQKQNVPFWQEAPYVTALHAPPLSRKQIDHLQNIAKMYQATLSYAHRDAEGMRSPLEKFSPNWNTYYETLKSEGNILKESTDLFVALPSTLPWELLGALRNALLPLLTPEKTWALAWIVDFPLFEKDENGDLIPAHHPFVLPYEEDISLLDTQPLAVRAHCYDLVINGNEIMSGSLRIHRPDLQRKIFSLLGLSAQAQAEKFGFLLEALSHGAPPHGGCAFGLDRWVMLLAGATSLREVIAFPKTAQGSDLMLGAPAPLDKAQIQMLQDHLKAAL